MFAMSRGYSVLDPDLFHQVIDPLKEEFPEVVIDGCMVCESQENGKAMKILLKEKLFETTPVNTNATYNGDMLFCKPAHVMIEKCRLVQEAGVIPQITFLFFSRCGSRKPVSDPFRTAGKTI